MLCLRSQDSKKRKAPTVNGPSAKKAKPSAESSSSDDSSSEEEEAAKAKSKAAPAGKHKTTDTFRKKCHFAWS